MELIKLGERALKVTLTREDMELYDIEFDMLDYADTKTRRVIWSILDEAKRSLGFEVVRDGLYIQAFRSRCGGCELFVSHEEKREKLPSLFRFSDSQSVIMASARLENCGFSDESRLYLGDSGDYYLVLPCENDKYIFLLELGTKLPYSKSYLDEHASPLCDNAVTLMAKLR